MPNYREDKPGAGGAKFDEIRPAPQGRSQQEQSDPHQRTHEELVTDVKAGLTVAHENWERKNGTNTFDPVMWIGERLTTRTLHTHDKEHQKRSDLSLAWDAITLPYLQSDDYRSTVNTLNSTRVMARGNNVVSLDHQEVALIDAMTDVLGIPHPRQQETVEILRTDTQKQHFRALYGSIHSRRCGI